MITVKALQKALLLTLTAAALGSAAPAMAALGGDVSSVEADRVSLKGALTGFRAGQSYGVHELTTASGVRLREYVAGGKVFAVSWQGPVIPDLRQVLGAYYATYARAAAAPHEGGHRHLKVVQPGLVVESSGRMRAFSGRAWDPALLPASFSVADIR